MGKSICMVLMVVGYVVSSYNLVVAFYGEPIEIATNFPLESALSPLIKYITGPAATIISAACFFLGGGLLKFGDFGTENVQRPFCAVMNDGDEHVSSDQHEDCFCQWCGSMVHGNRCDSCGGPRRKDNQ